MTTPYNSGASYDQQFPSLSQTSPDKNSDTNKSSGSSEGKTKISWEVETDMIKIEFAEPDQKMLELHGMDYKSSSISKFWCISVGRAKIIATFEGMDKTTSSHPKGLDIQLALAKDEEKRKLKEI